MAAIPKVIGHSYTAVGMAAVGAYMGGGTEDPVGALMGASVLGFTGALMRVSVPDLKRSAQVVKSVKLDMQYVENRRIAGVSEQTERKITEAKNKKLQDYSLKAENVRKLLKGSTDPVTGVHTPGYEDLLAQANAHLQANIGDKFYQKLYPDASHIGAPANSLEAKLFEIYDKEKSLGIHEVKDSAGNVIPRNKIKDFQDAQRLARKAEKQRIISQYKAVDSLSDPEIEKAFRSADQTALKAKLTTGYTTKQGLRKDGVNVRANSQIASLNQKKAILDAPTASSDLKVFTQSPTRGLVTDTGKAASSSYYKEYKEVQQLDILYNRVKKANNLPGFEAYVKGLADGPTKEKAKQVLSAIKKGPSKKGKNVFQAREEHLKRILLGDKKAIEGESKRLAGQIQRVDTQRNALLAKINAEDVTKIVDSLATKITDKNIKAVVDKLNNHVQSSPNIAFDFKTLSPLEKTVLGKHLNSINAGPMVQLANFKQGEADLLKLYGEAKPLRQQHMADWKVRNIAYKQVQQSQKAATKQVNYLNKKLAKLTPLANNLDQISQNLLQVTGNQVAATTADLEAHAKTINSLRDANVLSAIYEGHTPIQQSVLEAVGKVSSGKSLYMHTGGGAGSQQVLSDHFKSMGLPVAEADRKAQLILDRAKSKQQLVINNDTLSFTDRHTNKRVNLPLTRQIDDGAGGRHFTHTSRPGNTNAVVGMNPYLDAFRKGEAVQKIGDAPGSQKSKVTLNEAIQRWSPDMLALELASDGSAIDVEMINKMMRYGSGESAVTGSFTGNITSDQMSSLFKHVSKQTDYSMVLQDNANRSEKLRPIRVTNTSQAGQSSELKAGFSHLNTELSNSSDPQHQEMALNARTGVSVNNPTSRSGSVNAPINPLVMNARGGTAVGNRSSTILNKTSEMERLHRLYGDSAMSQQFGSSNAFNKLDITNRNLFNDISSEVFGSNLTLADGGGLFNRAHSGAFAHTESVSLNLGAIEGGYSFIKDENVLGLLQSASDVHQASTRGIISLGNKRVGDPEVIDAIQKAKYLASDAGKQEMLGILNDSSHAITSSMPQADITHAINALNSHTTGDMVPHLERLLSPTAGPMNGYEQEVLKGKDFSIKFKPGQVIGKDANGDDVKVHSQYSEAKLKSMYIDDENNLRIQAEATFTPQEEGQVKLFGEDAKSNLQASEHYTKQALLGHLLNTDQIDDKGLYTQKAGQAFQGQKVTFDNLSIIHDDIMARGRADFAAKQSNTPNYVKQLSDADSRAMDAMATSVILDADETKTSVITDVLKQADSTSVRDKLKANQFYGETLTELDSFVAAKAAIDPNLSTKAVKVSAIHAFTTGNFKAGTGMALTVGHDLMSHWEEAFANPSAHVDTINTLQGMGITTLDQAADTYASLRDAREITGAAGEANRTKSKDLLMTLPDAAIKKYEEGQFLTVAAINKGESTLGVGKEARMSWTAQDQLLKSGFTKDELRLFGNNNNGLLLDFAAMQSERHGTDYLVRDKTINDAVTKIPGHTDTAFEKIISGSFDPTNKAPENRITQLKAAGIAVDESNPFLTYKLQNRFSSKKEFKGIYDLEHLNFSTVSTNRSGFSSRESYQFIKGIEKKKLEIFKIDNLLAKKQKGSSGYDILVDEFNKLGMEYNGMIQNAYKGGNSLLKDVLALESKNSNIGLVKTIGGEAEKFIGQQSGVSKGLFLSEEGLQHRLTKLNLGKVEYGVNVQLSDVTDDATGKNFNNLKKLQIKTKDGSWIDFHGMISREPTQGPLSTTYEQFYLDTSIKDKNSAAHVFITNNNNAYKYGKYGDFDQDTVQELFRQFDTATQHDSIKGKFDKIKLDLADTIEIANKFAVKGSKQVINTTANMSSVAELAEYTATEGNKGVERKVLAPESTALSISIGSAIEKSFVDGGASKEALESRFLGHVLVENLIKSAHVSTKDFAAQTQSNIEKLSLARKEYLKEAVTSDTRDKYKLVLESILGEQINMPKIEADMAAGATGALNSSQHLKVKAALDRMITAELDHAHAVDYEALSPLDVKRNGKNGNTMFEAANEMMGHYMDTDKGFDLHGTRSYGRIARDIKVSIAETFRNNKGLLGLAAAGLAATAMMTRDAPEVSQQERKRMLNNAKSIRAADVPEGIETNPSKKAYVTPQNMSGGRSVNAQGSFNNFHDYTQTESYVDTTYDMSQAIFGDSLQSARIEY